VRERLEPPPPAAPGTVQMNTAVGPDVLELRNRLADDLGWTHRKVIETALIAFDRLLGDIPRESDDHG